jgi:hypothetical protein
MRPDLVIPDALGAEEHLWVPLGPGLSSRPLQFNVTQGQYTHLFKVKRSGIVQRHRHGGPVLGWVLKGRWHYLEHDWVAEKGTYVFEPPGETHTLVVPEGCDEMISLFQVTGTLVYVDEEGATVGYDDVFRRLEITRDYYASIGLPDDRVEELIR